MVAERHGPPIVSPRTAAALRALAANRYAVLRSFWLPFLNAFLQGAMHCGKLKV